MRTDDFQQQDCTPLTALLSFTFAFDLRLRLDGGRSGDQENANFGYRGWAPRWAVVPR